jgi:hypothetical protein
MLEFLQGMHMPQLEWNTLTVGAAVGVAVLLGLALRPIATKVASLASSIFHKITDYFEENPIAVRLRSINCPKCASNHAMHIQEDKEEDKGNQLHE